MDENPYKAPQVETQQKGDGGRFEREQWMRGYYLLVILGVVFFVVYSIVAYVYRG